MELTEQIWQNWTFFQTNLAFFPEEVFPDAGDRPHMQGLLPGLPDASQYRLPHLSSLIAS
jgi:hypothetical protein